MGNKHAITEKSLRVVGIGIFVIMLVYLNFPIKTRGIKLTSEIIEEYACYDCDTISPIEKLKKQCDSLVSENESLKIKLFLLEK